MTRLKPFSGWIITPGGVDARTRPEPRWPEGRPVAQIDAAVLAPSMSEAGRLLTAATGGHYTSAHVRTYMSETRNAETLAALAEHEPGTVLVKGMNGQVTIAGHDDWVPLGKVRT